VQRAKVKEEDKRLILGMNARRLIDRVLTREAVALPEIV
jgi:hypothetical protein